MISRFFYLWSVNQELYASSILFSAFCSDVYHCILGFLIRRTHWYFYSLELMFNSANLLFVAFAAYHKVLTGQNMVFFVMTVAAAEVAVVWH
jgi:NADH:ubiquinone oxidoreductase subunit K